MCTVEEYLNRVGHPMVTAVDAQTLRSLAMTHVANVPFENMDMLVEIPIDLSKEYLWEKIVTKKRGGVCHELNNAFAYLLEALGYQVERYTARVATENDHLEHTYLNVLAEGMRYLVDVGCGSHPIPPVPYEGVVEGFGCRYQMGEVAPDGTTPLRYQEGEEPWQTLYHCYPQQRQVMDVAASYQQYAPLGASIFSTFPIVKRFMGEDSYTLVKETLTITKDGKQTKVNIPEGGTRLAALCTYFGIQLP